MTKEKEYIESFIFGLKLLTRISLLTVPLILMGCLIMATSGFLERTPLYKKDLIITKIWQIDNLGDFKTSAKSLEGVQKGDEVLFFASNDDKTFLVANTNRPAIDNEIQEVGEEINRQLGYSWNDKMESGIKDPKGYSANFTAIYGSFNGLGNIINAILIFLIVVCSLSLYFPIIKSIINLFKKPKSSLGV